MSPETSSTKTSSTKTWPRESPGEQGAARPALGPVTVTGLLVVHDGAAWLKECLDALVLQTRPPDRLVIIDTGSIDDSLQIAATRTRTGQVVGDVLTICAPRECTFGEAVRRAVEQQSTGSASSTAPSGTECMSTESVSTEWLWLLHDDSAAAPEALAHLLDATRRSPSVAVAGPKLTTWDDASRLLEVGQQITRSGARAGGPATGEPDQGQHDRRTDVLGVNTSGMLIRRDVFDALGGFDPAFGQFRDDLDICWRAHLAGHRVVVAPKARMREAAASANGQRSRDVSTETARRRARRRDRRHGRQVALARCSPYAVPFLTLWIALASLCSAAVLLVVKRPRRAWEEFSDLGSLVTPWRPIAARRRSRGIQRVRRRDLRGLFASPRAGFRETLDTIADAVTNGSDRSAAERVGSVPSSETGPSEDGEPAEAATLGVSWRILRHPGFLAVLVGAALAVVTWRSLLGALIPGNGPGVAGGELLPVSTGPSGLWHAWLDGWHGAGLGNALESAPYLPVLAAGAWVVEHLPLVDTSTSSVAASIAWLLAGAMPLSAWTAYLGARVVTRAQWPRAWAALAWASLGTLTTAQAGGRLGAVVAHILLPLVAAGFACATRRSTSWSVTVGAAAALGVTGAFNPALGAVGALAALVMLVVGPGATRLRSAVLLVVPVGLVGPWVTQLVDNPLLLLTGPGLTVWQGAATPPWQLALLHPGGAGSYPALLSAPIVLAGVVAMLRRGVASSAMTVLAVLTVTGLALGVAAPHVIIGLVPQGLAGAGSPITVWAGTGLDLAALALIAATLLGFDGLSGRLSRSGFGWRQILIAPVAAAAVLGVVASLATAGWFGVGEALTGKVPEIPAVAADQADGPLGSRLLIMSIEPMNSEGGTIGYRLVGREPGQVVRDLPSLPGMAVTPDPSLAAAVKIAVSDGDAASADAARDALADQGVGFVAFRGASTEPLVRRLDATAGMTRLGDNQGLILWRVLPRDNAVSSSRLWFVDAQGAPLRSIPVTGDHGRTDVRVVRPAMPGAPTVGLRLVVAEPARWADHARVTFAGRDLAAVAGGEQPAYDLPPTDGQLTIAVAPARQWWRWGQLGLLLVVLILASPFGAARSRRTA
jgi:GT2 family glycosyltransferase